MPQLSYLEPGPRLSLEDWLARGEDASGELVGGYLEEEEMPDFIHEILVMLLGRLLGNWVFPRGGAVTGSDARLVIAEDRGRKPDLMVYLPGSERPQRRGPIRPRPDLAIEIISPTPRDARRDRVEKVTDYAAVGIRWYWLLDPELRTLEILELGSDGRYVHALGKSAGSFDVPGCDGLVLDLDELWQDADRLAPEEEPTAADRES